MILMIQQNTPNNVRIVAVQKIEATLNA